MIEPIADSETKLERKKRLNRERQQRYIERQNPEQRKFRLAAVAQSARERRAEETQQQRELRIAAVAQSIREMRKNLSAEDRQEYLRQRRARRKKKKESQHQVDEAMRNEALHFNEESALPRDYESGEEDDQHDWEDKTDWDDKNDSEDTNKLEDHNDMKIMKIEFPLTRLSGDTMPSKQTMNCGRNPVQFDDIDGGLSESSKASTTEIQALREFLERKTNQKSKNQNRREYRRKRKFNEQKFSQIFKKLLESKSGAEYMKEYRHHSDAHSSHPKTYDRELGSNTPNQKDKILKEYDELLEKRKTEERIQIIREFEPRKPPFSFQVLAKKFHMDPEYIQKTVSEKEQILKSCKNYCVKTKKYKTWNETKTALTLSDYCESNTDDNIFKTADAPTSPDPSNLPAVKIEISPNKLIEYNEPQTIKTEVREDASMDISVLTSDDNNLEESDASNLEEIEDEAMETIYLSSDNEAADQSTTHKEDEMDSVTDKLLSIKTEPEMFQKNDGIDISCAGVKIKTEPQMLEEESIEWNAVKTHPQAIKVESIEIKTEPHHMLENAQAEGNSGNGIAIKREIITRENDEREKRSDEQRELMLNQNSIDSCPPCSDINLPPESLGNYKSVFLFECSEIVKMENDIHCDQQISLTKLPRTNEAYMQDFFPDDIDTLEEAMKLLEMLAIYAATTENCRAMIVLSQLEEALKEESN